MWEQIAAAAMSGGDGGAPDSSVRRASSDGSMFGTGWNVSTNGAGGVMPEWVGYAVGGVVLVGLFWLLRKKG